MLTPATVTDDRPALGRLRIAARSVLLLWAVASVVATGWVLSHHPFVNPLVQRSAAEARVALSTAVARQVSLDWLVPRLQAAVAEDDMRRVTLLSDLASDHSIVLPAGLQRQVTEAMAAHESWRATISDCRLCISDVARCPSLSLVAACTLPFELSPAGDAAALARQGGNLITGAEIDEVEAALAGIGLAATISTVLTAGSSLTVKGAATVLRVARRADALSPGLRRALREAARGPAPAATLGAMAVDIRHLAARTSNAEVLSLLRHADNPRDLRALTRLSDAAGTDTGRTLEVLGKARSLRLLSRISDLALVAMGLVALVLGQLAVMAGAVVKLWLRSLLRQREMALIRRP
ncbi:hypothetical protein [Paracoccus rhizosphaerae]|uniref:Uncharacterized protein n=1 Tax=Paracoccus rhizosphaerae TaxID=1133347 RepID=A0ABV6CMX7_9RHOB|nr:hypothetical protein [Paracoccus rhizosphaerae]